MRSDSSSVRSSRHGEALRTAADAADPRQAILAEVLIARGQHADRRNSAEDYEAWSRDAIHRFQEWGDDRGLAEAYLTQADLAFMRGHCSRSTRLLELALKHGEAAGDAGCIARARSLLGVALLFGPAPAEEGSPR